MILIRRGSTLDSGPTAQTTSGCVRETLRPVQGTSRSPTTGEPWPMGDGAEPHGQVFGFVDWD